MMSCSAQEPAIVCKSAGRGKDRVSFSAAIRPFATLLATDLLRRSLGIKSDRDISTKWIAFAVASESRQVRIGGHSHAQRLTLRTCFIASCPKKAFPPGGWSHLGNPMLGGL